jgi:hypothetical protein
VESQIRESVTRVGWIGDPKYRLESWAKMQMFGTETLKENEDSRSSDPTEPQSYSNICEDDFSKFLSLTVLHAVPESRLRLRWPIPVAASGSVPCTKAEDKKRETKRLEQEIHIWTTAEKNQCLGS